VMHNYIIKQSMHGASFLCQYCPSLQEDIILSAIEILQCSQDVSMLLCLLCWFRWYFTI
jgi:hypothetical protein